jgi:iron complex transport system permease protein
VRRTVVVRSPGERIALRLPLRALATCAGLLAACVLVGGATLVTGSVSLGPGEVLDALLGRGSGVAGFVVVDLRLPRLVMALLVGAALGAAGAIFQSLTRNPLGSPDVIGFTWGAAAGAVLAIVVLGGGRLATAGCAVGGGLLVALAVLGLARGGGAAGDRLILVGIGMSAMLAALTTWLIARADLGSALAARTWLAGSLEGRGWESAWPVLGALVLVAPAVAALAPRLAVLELGDDAATAAGTPVASTRFALLCAAVALTGVATAATGPIAFVALAAPQVGRRLSRAAGPGVGTAACTGAALLAVGDLGAQRLFGGGGLPVGVVTGAAGGTYLAWLLQREWRRR